MYKKFLILAFVAPLLGFDPVITLCLADHGTRPIIGRAVGLAHTSPRFTSPRQRRGRGSIALPQVASSLFLAKSSGFVLTHGRHLTRTRPNAWLYTFENASVLDSPIVEESFTAQNEGTQPIVIGSIASTCGCVQGRLSLATAKGHAQKNVPHLKQGAPATDSGGSPSNTLPVSIPPGGEATVTVRVNLQIAHQGAIQQTISLYGAVKSEPIATIQVRGVSLPPIHLEPTTLDLGAQQSGQSQPIRLTAEFDPRLLNGGPMPVLTSSSPAVAVLSPMKQEAAPETLATKATPTATATVGARATPQTGPQSSALIKRTYFVLVKPTANLGTLQGTLGFQFPAKQSNLAKRATTSENPAAANSQVSTDTESLWEAVSVPFSGRVLGAVSAKPEALAFVVTPSLDSRTKTIVLTEEALHACTGIRVTSPSKWLTATIVPAGTPEEENSKSPEPLVNQGKVGETLALQPVASVAPLSKRVIQIKVSISPDCPHGFLKSSVNVLLVNGQRLIIPVNVFVPPMK